MKALVAFVLLVGCSRDTASLGGNDGLAAFASFKMPDWKDSGSLEIPLGDLKLKATLTRFSKLDDGTSSWLGRFPNGGTVALTRRKDEQVGTIFYGNRMYRLESAPNGSARITRVTPPLGGHHQEPYKHAACCPPLRTMSGDIRILGVYTAKALATCTKLLTDIPHAVDITNQVMENSQIATRFEHAGTFALPPSFNEDNYTIQNLAANLTNSQNEDFKELHVRRGAVKADLVVLFTGPGAGVDGAAAETTAGIKTAFAVVRCSTAIKALSYVHEIGHLLGLNDDRDIPAQSTFAQGFGHTHDREDESESWRTIMASGAECKNRCDRVPYLSNPNVVFNKSPTGVVGRSDNADVLLKTSGAASRFY